MNIYLSTTIQILRAPVGLFFYLYLLLEGKSICLHANLKQKKGRSTETEKK